MTILALEPTIEETVSQYLVDRIGRTPNIAVRTRSTVIAANGKGHLEHSTIQNVDTGATYVAPANSLFVFGVVARARAVRARDEPPWCLLRG